MTVAYDGSAASRRTLALAAQLARGKGDGLTVLLLADDSEQATVLHAQAEGWLEEQGSRVRFRSLVDADVPRLAHAARAELNLDTRSSTNLGRSPLRITLASSWGG